MLYLDTPVKRTVQSILGMTIRRTFGLELDKCRVDILVDGAPHGARGKIRATMGFRVGLKPYNCHDTRERWSALGVTLLTSGCQRAAECSHGVRLFRVTWANLTRRDFRERTALVSLQFKIQVLHHAVLVSTGPGNAIATCIALRLLVVRLQYCFDLSSAVNTGPALPTRLGRKSTPSRRPRVGFPITSQFSPLQDLQ